MDQASVSLAQLKRKLNVNLDLDIDLDLVLDVVIDSKTRCRSRLWACSNTFVSVNASYRCCWPEYNPTNEKKPNNNAITERKTPYI